MPQKTFHLALFAFLVPPRNHPIQWLVAKETSNLLIHQRIRNQTLRPPSTLPNLTPTQNSNQITSTASVASSGTACDCVILRIDSSGSTVVKNVGEEVIPEPIDQSFSDVTNSEQLPLEKNLPGLQAHSEPLYLNVFSGQIFAAAAMASLQQMVWISSWFSWREI
ncbi:hypothetical protein DsansV1_C18g0154971 [Dioscorea sansibarensis]